MKKLLTVIICALLMLSSVYIAASDRNGTFENISYALISEGKLISGNNEDLLFPVGSVSKIFTAALTLELCEEKALSVDGKVCEYLPGFKMADERYKEITIRHLLNHTSGLMGSSLKNVLLYNDTDSYNHDNFLYELSGQRLKYAPGEMANYCNDGYTLLELIIEETTKMSYTEYLHSVFDEHLPDGSIKTVTEFSDYNGEYINSAGAMGIYSTAEAICVAGCIITSTDKILNKNSRTLMTEIRENALQGEAFGMGWDDVALYPFDKSGIKALTKSGDTILHHTAITVLPESGTVACVILEEGDSRNALMKANELIIDYLSGKNINVVYDEAYANGANTEIVPNEMKKYEGLYLSGGEQILFSIEENCGILRKLISGTEAKLLYAGEGRFATDKGYMYFSEINGRIYMIQEGFEKHGNGANYKNFDYYAEKKEPTGEISEAWKKRDGEVYLLCDEKYTSMLYFGNIPYARIKFYENGGDYLSYLRTVSDTLALCDIALPGQSGADLTDIEIFKENGKEYVKAQGNKYVCLSSVPDIYCGERSICTVLPDGYTRWFKSGDAAGKKITVKVNGNGMFALYNKNAECIYSSLRNEEEATVPEGGYIAFSGDGGTIFEINLA